MDRGWYIVVGGGTVHAGPFDSEMDAEKVLAMILKHDGAFPADAYDIVYEKGLTNPS